MKNKLSSLSISVVLALLLWSVYFISEKQRAKRNKESTGND